MTPVLCIDQLEKTYSKGWRRQEVMALRGISLEVAKGEVFGFIGPNGAGKSTTIKILTGAMKASRGRAEINGRDVNDPSARTGLGYVPENPYLNDHLTPLEVLQTGVRIHGLGPLDERAYCMEWLERFGLASASNRRIRTFSKGMMQRVVLAHALALKPSFLILDEPLSGLDPVGRKEVVELLGEYKRDGGTLFFTSHVLYDVERLADRFGLIHQGTLRAVCSPSELVGEDDRVVIRSYGGSPLASQQADSSQRWSLQVPQNRVWESLEQLRSAGQTLIEVRPAMSLETAFIKAVGRDGLL